MSTEAIRRFFNGVMYYPRSVALRRSIARARRLLNGPHSWSALDRMGVPGFGTDLIRIDFPPPVGPVPAWGHGKPVHRELAAIAGESSAAQHVLLGKCLAGADVCLAWPEGEDSSNASLPWRKNCFLTMLDMVASFGMLCEAKPQRYVEVGSGMSTRVAWQARHHGRFPMQILSIDPCPRVDVEKLCDEVFRKRFEDFPLADLVELSGEGCALFIDGSHRCFPGSDVTVFFLDILPRLKPGTLVHIHDIYLPADYPAWAGERYWSEQYLLAAYLLGGGRNLRVLLPCHYLGAVEPSKAEIARKLGKGSTEGSSFWMEITD